MAGLTPSEIRNAIKNGEGRATAEIPKISAVMQDAQLRLGRETEYVIKVPDYIMDTIKTEWEPLLAKRKLSFSPEAAILAIVRAEATNIVTKKFSLP